MARNKITIVGAGNVGATTAHIAATRHLGDIVLIDIIEGLAKGKALDIAEAAPVQLYDCNVIGTCDWKETAGSDVVIITSGLPRKPGMSRDDLLAKNAGIVKDVSEKIAKYSPDSIIIVVCNPLDAMVYTAGKVTGFAKNKVMGMAGALDSARFSCFLAAEFGVSVEDIKCTLMGGHGDDMVPLPRFTSVGGIPVTELLDEAKTTELIERTRKGGIEVVERRHRGCKPARLQRILRSCRRGSKNDRSNIKRQKDRPFMLRLLRQTVRCWGIFHRCSRHSRQKWSRKSYRTRFEQIRAYPVRQIPRPR